MDLPAFGRRRHPPKPAGWHNAPVSLPAPPLPASHLVFLLGICLIWAGNFIAAATGVTYMEPVTFTALRFAVVLVILLPLIRWPARDQWLTLLGCCWCMGAIHFALVFMALGRSEDVSSVAILMQVYVPLSTLLAVLLLGERIGWRTATGIGLSFGGVLVVGLDPVVLAQVDVLALVLTSAFFLALGTLLMRRLQGIGLFSFQAWNALLSLPPLMVLAWVAGNPVESITSLPATSPAWVALAYSAIGASIVGHGGFYWLIQRHEVNRITPFLLLVPVLAVGLGVLVWGDRPGPRLIGGGALVIAGVLWITLRARYRRPPPRIPAG